jgi:hypothetical protein
MLEALKSAHEPLDPSGPAIHAHDTHLLLRLGARGEELVTLLSECNGFYAFDRALLVRSWWRDAPPRGVQQWNDPVGWRSDFQFDLSRYLFFAEDVFGLQFAIGDDAVAQFDPETGGVSQLAPSVREWLDLVAADHSTIAGSAFAREWCANHGPLQPGDRLVPKTPFVLGGSFSLENLTLVEELKAMRIRSAIANSIKDVPEGGEVVFRIER